MNEQLKEWLFPQKTKQRWYFLLFLRLDLIGQKKASSSILFKSIYLILSIAYKLQNIKLDC